MLKIRYSAMRRGLLGLVVLTVTAGPANVGAATLRWKFKPGETLRYAMEQKTVTTLKVPGQQLETTLTQTIDLSWAVKDVAADGTADVSWTIDRMRTRIESAIGAFAYDSKDEKVPEGPVAAALVPTLKVLVGAQFPFKINPQGELSDVKVPEKVAQVLRDAGPAASGCQLALLRGGAEEHDHPVEPGAPRGRPRRGEDLVEADQGPQPTDRDDDARHDIHLPRPRSQGREHREDRPGHQDRRRAPARQQRQAGDQLPRRPRGNSPSTTRPAASSIPRWPRRWRRPITFMNMNIQRIVDTKTTMKLVPDEAVEAFELTRAGVGSSSPAPARVRDTTGSGRPEASPPLLAGAGLKGCTKSQIRPRIPHETQAIPGEIEAIPLRPDSNPVEAAQATAARGQARRPTPLRRPPRGPQRHLLHHPRRLRLADDAHRPAPLEHLLRLLLQVAQRRHLVEDQRRPAHPGPSPGRAAEEPEPGHHRQPERQDHRARAARTARTRTRRSTAGSGTWSWTRWGWSWRRWSTRRASRTGTGPSRS